MKSVNLIEYSKVIENKFFRELYLSHLSSLEHTLSFFDRKLIEATVIYHCEEMEPKFQTFVEVICDDEVFKLVIENALKRFNTAAIHPDMQPGLS